ncbi:MAG: 16S rRNA (adenine(1518)-N(6)/adenine(1519)-N(6))-dimethyltransferase RsmA [Oscillospiraceae bacterium]
MNLTDVGVIRSICTKHGFELSKGFGQNFIVNAGICPKIVTASGITSDWGVIEVGPGIGVLTAELAKTAKKVVAVEVYKRLPAVLAETLSEFSNVEIVLEDILKCDIAGMLRDKFAGMPVAVCANLPYYITSPIIMRLLEERLPIESITVMVQKEAATRICALPGTREAGAISYAVHYYAKPEVLFNVQPGSFYPPPKVTSAVIRLSLHKEPPVTPKDEKLMFRVIHAAFGQRRKTAANAISAGLGMEKARVLNALDACGLLLTVRPEQLTLAQYSALSDIL